MATLAPFDPKAHGREARIRALLEDLVQAHIQGRPTARMAIAIWYQKKPGSETQFLLELVVMEEPFDHFYPDRLSLLWKTRGEGQPYASVDVTSVDHFLRLHEVNPDQVEKFVNGNFEVLYIDKNVLSAQQLAKIAQIFHIVTEPIGLMKGWYVAEEEFSKSSAVQTLLSPRLNSKPELGMVKVWESDDFGHCRGILHVEINGKWLPLSPEGLRAYTYYADSQSGRKGYLMFEGGSLYEVLKFEVKTLPDYAGKFGLLEKAPNDRYPEVYLRTVRPPARPAA
jgi:hypothetical protein